MPEIDIPITVIFTPGIQLKEVENDIGNTDISSIGDGTVTGAISALNNSLTNLSKYNQDDGVYRTYQQLSGTITLTKPLSEIKDIFVLFCGLSNVARATGIIPAAFIKEFPTQVHQANVYVTRRSYIGLQYVDETHLTLSGDFPDSDYIDRVYIFWA